MICALIMFIQQVYKSIRVKSIVVDFIQDTNGQVWLTDVKRISTIQAVKFSRLTQNMNEMPELKLYEHRKHMLLQRDKV